MEASDGKEMILQSGAFLMPGKDKKMIEKDYEVETNEMPKSAVNYRKPRRLSAEQRQAASERANNLHNKGDKSVS